MKYNVCVNIHRTMLIEAVNEADALETALPIIQGGEETVSWIITPAKEDK